MSYMGKPPPGDGEAQNFGSQVDGPHGATPSGWLQEAGSALIEALLDGAADTTQRTVATWRSRLTPEQRHQALVLAGAAAEPADMLALVSRLNDAGEPRPVFDGLAEEAALWADWASVAERRAYLAALVARLDGVHRAALRRHLGGRR